MKNEFIGFYDPTSEEINKSWSDAAFVFDANALLNLYRYSTSTRNDFLLVIEKLKDKLFMPYQVGYEYHSNRLPIIESLKNSYIAIDKGIKELLDIQLKNHLNQFRRHPSIELESILDIKDDFLKGVADELEKQKKNHPNFNLKDDVLTQLTKFYENRVGKAFTKDELKKIYVDGKERYEQLIPPGYKDLETKKKKGEQHVYGDLIIWKEIIAFAKKEKKPIIFITDDRKEDWWTIENGKTIRPREELIKEFYDVTGIRILIYNADNFLHFAKERKLVSQIKEESIDEVKEIRKADENLKNFVDLAKHDHYRKLLNFAAHKGNFGDITMSDQLKSWMDLNSKPSSFGEIKTSGTIKNWNDLTSASGSLSDIVMSDPLENWRNIMSPSGSLYEIAMTDPYKNWKDLISWDLEKDIVQKSTKKEKNLNSLAENSNSTDGNVKPSPLLDQSNTDSVDASTGKIKTKAKKKKT